MPTDAILGFLYSSHDRKAKRTLVPVILVQVDLGHHTLIVAVEHDCNTSEKIDGLVHGVGILEFEHPTLAVTTDEVFLPFPRRRVVDVVDIFLVLFLVEDRVRALIVFEVVCRKIDARVPLV